MHTELPGTNEQARRDIYQGAIFQLAPSDASLELVSRVKGLLRRELRQDEVRLAHGRLPSDLFFQAMGRIRKILFLESEFHSHVRAVIAAAGFAPERIAFDPLRLRVVNHLGHQDPRAGPVYYPHRDTWYAHSQSIIAWWIPLDDVVAQETFEFYPDCFRTPVDNESQRFEYTAWVKDGWDLKIGWQDDNAGLTAVYPRALVAPPIGSGLGFSCQRGGNVLFSGAHLHRTLPQETGRTRFSLDFRIVNLDDHAQALGAPNVDNRSRGSALIDYVRPFPGDGD